MPNTPIKCNSYLIVLEGDELVISQSGHQSIQNLRITCDQLEVFCAHLQIARRDRTPVVKEECRG